MRQQKQLQVAEGNEMINQLFTVLCSAGVALTAQAGYAESGQVGAGDDWYVNFNSSEDSNKEFAESAFFTPENFLSTNEAMSVSFGYMLESSVQAAGSTKVEAEFLWGDNEVTDLENSGRVITAGMMANVIYDFNTDSYVTPYFGAGVGAASVNAVGSEIQNSAVPAYQTMAGVSYTSTKHPYTSIQLGYRYFSTIAPIDSYTSHNLDAGIKVTF